MNCVGCGDELPEERAALGYLYCVKKVCVQEHMKPLQMLAVGVNKAADQFILLDDEVRKKAEAGEFRKDSRRQGAIAPADSVHATVPRQVKPIEVQVPMPRQRRLPGSRAQWTLIWLYNEQGIKPDEIAERVRLSRYDVTQVILARNWKNSSM